MKLLLDQNISYKVARLLENSFAEVKHVSKLGLVNVADTAIWDFAKINGYSIVTFDSDFIDLAVLYSSLPKIIWLKFGNAPNLKVANKIISHREEIHEFLSDDKNEIFFLEIN